MRRLNIVGSFLILIVSIVVSFQHNIELFSQNGFKGWNAILTVIGVELTFIIASINIVYSRIKRMKVGAPTIVSALIGTALVGWSNINAGMAHGIEGVIIGLVTPTLLICSEAMLSHTLLNSPDHQNAQNKEPNSSPELAFQNQPNVLLEESPKWVAKEFSDPQVENKSEQLTNCFMEESSSEEFPMTKNSSNNETRDTKSGENQSLMQTNTPQAHQITLPLNEPGQKNNVVQLEKKPTSSPLEFATRYYEKNGKHISRRGLAEEFGISEYRARKVIEELKKQIS